MKRIFIILMLFSVLSLLLWNCKSSQANKNNFMLKEPGAISDCIDDDLSNNIRILLNDTKKLNNIGYKEVYLQISSIEHTEINEDSIIVRVVAHPIDELGDYLIGMSLYKDVWCTLIDSSQFMKDTIRNYTISSHSAIDREPLAIMFVLDHSGSMTSGRDSIIQKSIYDFLNKTPVVDDTVMIVQFDTQVKEMMMKDLNDPFTKEEFYYDFVKGDDGFGGGTSLYDGIGKGIELLEKTGDQFQKVIVVLTDGYENSSINYRDADTLVRRATKAGIKICTIGFNDQVDKVVLADSISQRTGGIYHQICKRDQFNVVFKDVYNRLKNYYEIEYRIPKYIGIHYVKLSLCMPYQRFDEMNIYINPMPDTNQAIVLRDIYFDYNKSTIKRDSSRKALEMVANLMKSDPELKITIEGHTDSIGGWDFNLKLSKDRALAVQNALMAMGIEKSRLNYIGKGESKPVADNATEDGRMQNRRVEFIINEKSNKRNSVAYYRTPDESMIVNPKIAKKQEK